MAEKNIPKLIAGILIIFVIVLAWLIFVSINKYRAGGGLIIVIPLYYIVMTIWDNMVLQKPKQKVSKMDYVSEKSGESELIDTGSLAKVKMPEEYTTEIHINRENEYVGNLWSRIFQFLTFQSPTFKSVFDEGQRRFVTILSLIIPIGLSFLIFNLSDEFFGAIPVFYLMFFIGILFYIWVREGQGKVRPGGNAMKSLKYLIFSILGPIGIILIITLVYEQIYYPYKQKQEMIEVYKEFHDILQNEEWDNLSMIFDDNVNGMEKNVAISGFKEAFKSVEISNGNLTDIHFVGENEISGKFSGIWIDKKGKQEFTKISSLKFLNRYNHYIVKFGMTEDVD